jgi:hypothetical protein
MRPAAHMGMVRNAHNTLASKSEGKKSLGKPSHGMIILKWLLTCIIQEWGILNPLFL